MSLEKFIISSVVGTIVFLLIIFVAYSFFTSFESIPSSSNPTTSHIIQKGKESLGLVFVGWSIAGVIVFVIFIIGIIKFFPEGRY